MGRSLVIFAETALTPLPGLTADLSGLVDSLEAIERKEWSWEHLLWLWLEHSWCSSWIYVDVEGILVVRIHAWVRVARGTRSLGPKGGLQQLGNRIKRISDIICVTLSA